eukprot:2953009-Pleurochrysis_carterae.AAC.2
MTQGRLQLYLSGILFMRTRLPAMAQQDNNQLTTTVHRSSQRQCTGAVGIRACALQQSRLGVTLRIQISSLASPKHLVSPRVPPQLSFRLGSLVFIAVPLYSFH